MPYVHNRLQYEARKAAGLCPRCKGDPEPGKVTCRACIAKVVDYQRRNAEAHRAAMRKATRKRLKEFREAGLCYRCASPCPASMTRCMACKVKDIVRKKNREFVRALLEAAP